MELVLEDKAPHFPVVKLLFFISFVSCFSTLRAPKANPLSQSSKGEAPILWYPLAYFFITRKRVRLCPIPEGFKVEGRTSG